MILGIDIESFSDISLPNAGVYRYVDSPAFRILLLAYAFDDDPVKIIDLASGERIPKRVEEAIKAKNIIKAAYNAQFERVCLSKHFGINLEPESWICTMVKALTLGLPAGLDNTAKALGFPLDKQKMFTGKNLIRLFCLPRKAQKENDDQACLFEPQMRYLPQDKPTEWQQFKAYCIQDVVVERDIRKKLERFQTTDDENKIWFLDQQINDYGVKLDLEFVQQAISIDEQYTVQLMEKYKKVTGLDNPKSVAQLKDWLKQELGVEVKSITKETMPELMEAAKDNKKALEALRIRQETAKTSVSKYTKMQDVICSDMRARGLLQFYGANRTGRWAGRLIQVQNLPQNKIEDLDVAREIVRSGDLELFEMVYDKVPNILSQLIRTAFIPSDNHRFIVSDFSAIEARVIAWLSGESWRMEVFKTHGKIYEASAAQMFRVPIESIGKGNPLRQKGKVAELACIAEGQLVLTDIGLVPIEKVTLCYKVWDGENFVSHDGVIYKGVREVINYEGLTATKDHLVWVEGTSWPVRFGSAASSGAHLLQSGSGKQTLRISEDYKQRKTLGKRLAFTLCTCKMRKLWKGTVDALLQSYKREIKRLPTVLITKADTKMARPEIYGSKAEMHKPKGWKLQELWRERDRIPFQICSRSRTLDDRELWPSRERKGVGQDRGQRTLRTRKSQMGNSSGELPKSTKVYDILNCGKNNRFTVNNVLVHNCGYQGSVGALIQMGALKMGLQEAELKPIIDQWRAANTKIVQFWYDVEDAVVDAISNRTTVELQHGLKFIYQPGILFIQLPSGRRIAYVKPKLEEHDRFKGQLKITYEGMDQTTNTWVKIDTYAGKIVENIVQATARDCLRDAMLNVAAAGYKIAFHVHDEIVMDVPIGEGSREEISAIMGKSLPWAPDLPLRGDAYECSYYMKD